MLSLPAETPQYWSLSAPPLVSAEDMLPHCCMKRVRSASLARSLPTKALPANFTSPKRFAFLVITTCSICIFKSLISSMLSMIPVYNSIFSQHQLSTGAMRLQKGVCHTLRTCMHFRVRCDRVADVKEALQSPNQPKMNHPTKAMVQMLCSIAQ